MAVHAADCTPMELAIKLREHEDFVLLDVRSAEELSIVKLDPCIHVPLQEVKQRITELESCREKEIVCMCHHGMRSAMAAGLLRQAGFTKVRNLTGGIDAYAAANDPSMVRY
ncbi:MAG: hypothetical protein AMXMBFR84_14070 [Candidatus Hydrogenedentota bacterium]